MMVSVRLLATQQNLEEFFSTQKIKITLYSGHELLGSTEVELGDVTFEEQTAKWVTLAKLLCRL